MDPQLPAPAAQDISVSTEDPQHSCDEPLPTGRKPTLVKPIIDYPPNSAKRGRNKAPVFVTGCCRSGTTLLYHMLLSAGNFAVYRMESATFTHLEPLFRPLNNEANKRRMLNAWYKTRLYTRSGLQPSDIEERIMAECRNGGDFLRILMEGICRKQGVERWAEKTPEHLLYLPRIKETIPNAIIIHVIRDGRDVALSLEKLSWIRRLPWDRKRSGMAAAIYWEWMVNQGRRDGRMLAGDYVEVHYEDLVHKPAEVLKSLGAFIDHDLDYERITRVAIGAVSVPNTAFKVDQRSPVERWKLSLSQKDVAILEGLVGDTLQELGYELGTNPPTRFHLTTMRTAYRAYFDCKRYLKARSPAVRWFTTSDLADL